MFGTCIDIVYLCIVNNKQNYSKTYIMKALNNTQKLFTRGQLIAVIAVTAVIATLVVLWLTQNFSSFANHIQG